MAKDNPGTRPDPGAAKTTKTSKPGNRPKRRDQWLKEHWASYAMEMGVEGADKMSLRQIRDHLNKLKKEGVIPNLSGGAREGAGRKKTVQEHINDAYDLIANHAMTEVDVQIIDKQNPGEVKVVKMTRVEALTQKLFSLGNGGNVAAINAYLDRFAGKPKQSIEHTGDIKVEEQNTPSAAEEAAARAYEDALERGLPVKSPMNV